MVDEVRGRNGPVAQRTRGHRDDADLHLGTGSTVTTHTSRGAGASAVEGAGTGELVFGAQAALEGNVFEKGRGQVGLVGEVVEEVGVVEQVEAVLVELLEVCLAEDRECWVQRNREERRRRRLNGV